MLYFRSANSFSCPLCENPLQVLAAALPLLPSPAASALVEKSSVTSMPSTSKDTSVKRSYYMMCVVCRWTSRDSHMDDASVGKVIIIIVTICMPFVGEMYILHIQRQEPGLILNQRKLSRLVVCIYTIKCLHLCVCVCACERALL